MVPMPSHSSGLRLGTDHVPILLEKMRDFVEVAFTTDGKHLVTRTTLQADIVKAVDDSGGRASAPRVAASTGFDQDTIFVALGRFWTEDRHGRCIQIGDTLEIFTSEHLASLAREADTTAAKLGRITLRDLALRFNLPVEVTEALVYEWMRDTVPRFPGSEPRLINGSLVTETYATSKRDALYAACCDATEPRPVQDLMKECVLAHPEEEDFSLELLDGLMASGRVKGSLSGGGRARAYVPDAFVAAQHEAAYAFFSANGYLDHATALDLNVQARKLHAFVKEKHPSAVCLETVVVSRTVVERLDAVADGAVAEASWFEAWTIVPTALSEADAARLVGMCAACSRSDGDPLKVLQLGVFGVSTRFAQDIVSRFREEVASELEHAPCWDGPRGSEGKACDVGSGGGGKQRRRGGSRKADSETGPLSEDEAQHFVRRCKPELHDFPRLAEALGAHLAPALGQVKAEEVRRASKVDSAGGSRDRAGSFEAAFEKAYWEFQLHYRGVQALRQSLQRGQQQRSVPAPPASSPGLDPDISEASAAAASSEGCRAGAETVPRAPDERAEEYLLRSAGAQIAEMLTTRECEKLGIPFASQEGGGGGGGGRQQEQRMPIISKEASSALSEVLPRDVASSLVRLWQAATDGTCISDFCNVLKEQVFPACSLVCKRLDKRRERQIAADKQRALKESLFRSVSERDVLHFAALLVFRSVTGGFLLLPRPTLQLREVGNDRRASWSRVLLEAVQGEMPSETEQCLTQLEREIEVSERATITARSADGDEEGKDADPPENSDNAADTGSRQESDGAGLSVAAGAEAGETAVARLMRSTEAARALGMACGD